MSTATRTDTQPFALHGIDPDSNVLAVHGDR